MDPALSDPAWAAPAPTPKAAPEVPAQLQGPATEDELNRQIVQDLVDYDEDPEVRAAAQEALASNDPKEIADFLNKGLPIARAAAAARNKELADDNRAVVKDWAENAGPIARRRAAAVLATGDDARIADFIAVGKAVADAEDAQAVQDAAEMARKIELRVKQMVAMGGFEVQTAGQAALDSGDSVVIAEFYNKGYAEARQRDDYAQKQIDDALAQRSKAISDINDLAVRSAQAATARKQILVASMAAAQALTTASNTMGLTSKDAKQGDKIYEQDKPIRAAGGKSHTADLVRLSGSARRNAEDTKRHAAVVVAQAGVARTAAEQLTKTGLSHGVDWAEVTAAQAAAAEAADHAADTARHAAEATEAASKALDADRNATVDAANALKYRKSAEQHQLAAEKLAATAAKLAAAAQAAESDARAQRIKAEEAERRADQHAKNAETHYQRAIVQRNIARDAMAIALAQSYAANVAARGAVAQHAIVKAKAVNAQKLTESVRKHGADFDKLTKKATPLIKEAQTAAGNADATEFRAKAAEAKALAAKGTAEEAAAQREASAVRGEAVAARSAANRAQGHAQDAAGAASAAGVAAQQAAAAAVAAHAEAAAARQEAAAAHQEAGRAAAAAQKAIADSQTASTLAQAAINAARTAVGHAVAAKADADLTRASAESAAFESGMASFQARVAGRSALGARISAAAIASSAETAIDIAAAYSDTDNDAALAEDVATMAMALGVQHSASAQKHADDATLAANHAAVEASNAALQIKPAFEAASKAAAAAAKAVQSSKVAIDAALGAQKEAAAAVTAANGAAQADRRAAGFATGAERMATEASNDAAVARQAYNNARSYAGVAATAASQAKKMATQVEGWATAVTNIANAMTKTAEQLRKLATTLEGKIEEVDTAEEKARKRAFFQWLQDQAKKLRDIPYLGKIYQGEADALIGMVEGMWTTGRCFVELASPGDNATCKEIIEGFKAIVDHPGMLIHSDEWDEDWQYAYGLTAIDVVTLFIPGGKVGSIIRGPLARISAQLAKSLAEALASAVVKFGGKAVKDALEKLGPINTARFAELAEIKPNRFTFGPLEIYSIGRALDEHGFDAVEQAIRKLNDGSSIVDALKNLIPDCAHNSFAAGTPVLLANGARKPIGTIDNGDMVLATNPDTGRTSSERVIALHRNRDTDLVDLTIAGAAARGNTLQTTQRHPLWNSTTRRWTNAGDFKPTDTLSTPTGERVVVNTVRRYTGSRIMHNLTVANIHTYYVIVGNTPVLVHNCGGAADATEIVTKKADQYHGSRDEARAAALRGYGISDESLVETRIIYGKDSPNLRGPNGEPYEQLDAINDNGEIVTIDHHSNGHYFADNNTFARPHYHGPNGEHHFYGKRVW